MALTGQNNNATFFGISNGKIVQSYQTPQPGSTERINKNGRTVYEIFSDFIEGHITDISIKEHQEYGKSWLVTIEKDGEKGVLQFNYSSGYANGFLKALPNVDLSSKVKLSPMAKKEGDKTKTTIFVNQHGAAIKWAYTKEDPNSLPPLKKIKVKGKEQWDDTDSMAFLEDMVKNEILPEIKKLNAGAKVGVVVHDAVPVDSDEAPF